MFFFILLYYFFYCKCVNSATVSIEFCIELILLCVLYSTASVIFYSPDLWTAAISLFRRKFIISILYNNRMVTWYFYCPIMLPVNKLMMESSTRVIFKLVEFICGMILLVVGTYAFICATDLPLLNHRTD